MSRSRGCGGSTATNISRNINIELRPDILAPSKITRFRLKGATSMRKLAAFLVFLISIPLAAQTIRGRVTTEGSPLPGVTVSIPELGLTTLTDNDGHYSLTLPANRKGSVKITASFQ